MSSAIHPSLIPSPAMQEASSVSAKKGDKNDSTLEVAKGIFSGKKEFLRGVGGGNTFGLCYEPSVEATGWRYTISGWNQDLKPLDLEGNEGPFVRALELGKRFQLIGERYRKEKPESRFFVIKEKLRKNKEINCFFYALSTYGKRLEILSGMEMRQIEEDVVYSKLEIKFIEKCFRNVTEPHEGDLVVYEVEEGIEIPMSDGSISKGITHAGVYRQSNRSNGLPLDGAVESKWGWRANPFIFQHEVFFTPHIYGTQVKFYRLKDSTGVSS